MIKEFRSAKYPSNNSDINIIKQMTRPNEYTVRDVNAAAFLEMYKIELLRTDSENNLLIFVFSGYRQCKEILQNYYSGKAVGNIKEFVDAQRRIKALITEYKQGGGVK